MGADRQPVRPSRLVRVRSARRARVPAIAGNLPAAALRRSQSRRKLGDLPDRGARSRYRHLRLRHLRRRRRKVARGTA